MGRTAAAGIRISAGKSSKKVGGAHTQPSSLASTKSGGSSNKLPPIPHQETPSWQKPITNFFKSNSPTKSVQETTSGKEIEPQLEEEQKSGPSKKLKLDDEGGIEEITKETHSEENKENKSKDTSEFDAGASSSKE